MSKKNTPDTASNKSQSDSVADSSVKKRKGFISEFDMWDINLDISSDDMIDPTIRSGESAKKKDPTETQPVTESRAKATPIANRATKPAVVSKPKEQIKPAANKPVSTSVASSRAAEKPNASNRPVASTTAKKASPQATPQQSRQHKAVQQKPVSAASKASSAPAARAPRADNAKHQDTAVFTTRDVNRKIIPQDFERVEELKKKRRREKFFKFASLLWVVVDSLWELTVKLGKLIWKMLPVLYRHKMVVGAALVSFVIGMYFGNSGSDPSNTQTVKAVTAPSNISHKNAPVKKAVKKPAHHTKPAVESQNTGKSFEPTAAAQQNRAVVTVPADQSAGSDLAPNQFSGKDIPISGDGMAVQSDQGGLVNDTVKDSNQAMLQSSVPANEILSTDESAGAGQVVMQDPSATHGSSKDAELKRLLDQNTSYFNQKQWQQVVESSAQILLLKPFTEAALINRSVANTELGKYDLAIEDTNTLIIMNKRNGVAYNNRAYAYEKAGILEKAVADYQKACQLGVKQSCGDVERLRKQLPASD